MNKIKPGEVLGSWGESHRQRVSTQLSWGSGASDLNTKAQYIPEAALKAPTPRLFAEETQLQGEEPRGRLLPIPPGTAGRGAAGRCLPGPLLPPGFGVCNVSLQGSHLDTKIYTSFKEQ